MKNLIIKFFTSVRISSRIINFAFYYSFTFICIHFIYFIYNIINLLCTLSLFFLKTARIKLITIIKLDFTIINYDNKIRFC